jgi:hypothetical protein
MEQTLLDSSKYRIYSLSIDSRFAATKFKGTADFLTRLPQTYRNIMRVALSSVELPLVEYLFSGVNTCGAGHGNINFTVDLSGERRGFEIAEGNYDSTALAAAIQTQLQTAVGAQNWSGFICDVDPITGLVTIAHPSAPFSFNGYSTYDPIAERPAYWGLGYYLGLRSGISTTTGFITATGPDASGGYAITGSSMILTVPTPYYLLQLETPDMVENITHCVAAGGSVPAFAKLVLRDEFYTLQFVDNGDYMRKEFTYLAPSNIASLRVRLLDPWGAPVDMRDMDWSLTFELYEVVNSRTAGRLNTTYMRE